MTLLKDWHSAKKRYDAARKDALRQIKTLQQKRDAAEYFLEAQTARKLDDEAHMRKIRAFRDEFTSANILKIRVLLDREINDLSAIDARPFTGIEQALNDLERVLGAAEKLISKGDVAASSWNQYREIYDGCTHRLMAANDRFDAFSSRRANLEAKLALRLDHAEILRKIGQRSRAVHVFLKENEVAG